MARAPSRAETRATTARSGPSAGPQARELVGLSDAELRTIRGNDVAMIFQDPLTSLDPTKTIGYQVAEPVRLHKGASKAAAMARATEVLSLVGLPRPEERLGDYPHQLSGGMRQRVMIAMALSCEPRLLIGHRPAAGSRRGAAGPPTSAVTRSPR
jgi:peptide/nickel transport system ATP-binding protein